MDGLNITFVTAVKGLVKEETNEWVVITKVKEPQQWIVIEGKPEHGTLHSNPRTIFLDVIVYFAFVYYLSRCSPITLTLKRCEIRQIVEKYL